MPEILFHYERVNPTSWAYLSSLLTLALFFKFNRVFSVRNLDLFLLISLAPGLLLVQWSFENEASAPEVALRIQRIGFLWLFVVNAILLTRLLMDTAIVRRPLLEPNLNPAGLMFLGSSLLFFLMANVVTGTPRESALTPALSATEIQDEGRGDRTFETDGPGYWLLYLLPKFTTQEVVARTADEPASTPQERAQQKQEVQVITARVMTVLAHVLIVTGLIVVGAYHFDNLAAGLGAAAIYLLVPYTALRAGDIEHCLPGALLTWAIVFYRRPLAAGLFIGLASGTMYYPIFLLPLWCSYYWERGIKRFLTGVLLTVGGLVAALALTAGSLDGFTGSLTQMFGLRLPLVNPERLGGIWRNKPDFWNSVYRLPFLAAFVLLAFSFIVWPFRKHLGTLLCCTAALMVGTQFWYAYGGGQYVAWYLPLLLLTIFRPNLEDRLAVTMVPEGWWQARKRTQAAAVTQTAA